MSSLQPGPLFLTVFPQVISCYSRVLTIGVDGGADQWARPEAEPLIEDEDSIIFQQIDIREKYAVGKYPEFMMYGVTQVRLFASPPQLALFGGLTFIHSVGRQQRSGARYRISPLLLRGCPTRLPRRRPRDLQIPSQCISRTLRHFRLSITTLKRTK